MLFTPLISPQRSHRGGKPSRPDRIGQQDRRKLHARVALCGLIAGYNDVAPALSSGPRNFGNLLLQRVRLEGFIVLDNFARAHEIVPQLAEWMAEGKLNAQETVVDGFTQLPIAINMLVRRGEHGQARREALTSDTVQDGLQRVRRV